LKQWLKVRELVEKDPQTNVLIESPYNSDIIFRKGASLVSHSGNTALRTLVVAKARKELLDADQSHPKKTGQFVEEIIAELRAIGHDRVLRGVGKPCRFLVWNEAGWWEELHQDTEIHTRVEYIARGIRNTVLKNHKACHLFATTNHHNPLSENHPSPALPPRIPSSAAAAAATAMPKVPTPRPPSREVSMSPGQRSVEAAPMSPLTIPQAATTTTTTISNGNGKRVEESPNSLNGLSLFLTSSSPSNTQHQNGGTNIFRSLDHSTNEGMMKKRRLVVSMEDDQDTNPGGGRRDSMCGEAECFGMKFNSTNRYI